MRYGNFKFLPIFPTQGQEGLIYPNCAMPVY